MNDNRNFLLEDEEELVEVVIKPKDKESALKKERKRFRKQLIITAIVMTIITGLFFGFGLIWQRRYDLWAISNALWLTFAFEFFVAWIFFVYNKNILSPLIHGFKVFGLMIVGKRTKESYFEYSQRIEENPIPKFIYYMVFIFSFIVLIPAVITMILVMK